jgi:hypothetical protein
MNRQRERTGNVKRALVGFVVALSACGGQPGPEGPEGPEGPAGPPGSSSGATGRIVVRDASGAFVAYDSAQYQDGAGLLWSLDVETAKPYAVPAQLYYAAASCAGPAYVAPPVAGTPLRVGDAWVRRPLDLQSQVVALASMKPSTAGGACSNVSLSLRVVGLSALTSGVVEPSLPFVPPLRVVRE